MKLKCRWVLEDVGDFPLTASQAAGDADWGQLGGLGPLCHLFGVCCGVPLFHPAFHSAHIALLSQPHCLLLCWLA